MADLEMVLTIAAFFALSWGFVLLCDRLSSTPDGKSAPAKGTQQHHDGEASR